ncbi:MAG: CAP domain-containing protein [Pseudomonadota bacterium]
MTKVAFLIVAIAGALVPCGLTGCSLPGGVPGLGGTGGAGGQGTAAGTGGSEASGTGGTGATGGTGGSSGGGAGGGDVCARWKADRADMTEGAWTGAVASCSAGDMTAAARANVLRLVNLYRWLAALPPVDLDAALNVKDQACALMMRANNMLSHMPPGTWTCWTQSGADGAGSSNISTGQAVGSVDSYMIDNGNATTIGHRRWILSNSLGPIGVGGTDRSSCMWTLNGKGEVGKVWMAWPASGTIPLQAVLGARGQSLDTTGWTVQSDTINLAGAQVAVTVDGVAQPVTVTQLDPNYGSRYALRFNPTGWTTQAGKTYSVAVTGIATPISYTVQIVDCP